MSFLERTFNKSTELRDYQARDVQQIEEALGKHRSVFYCLPTGGGKTVIGAAVIKRAIARGERVLVLTHRREILNQTSFKLTFGDIEHGLIQAGLNVDLDYPVQVASVQTLWARCMRTNRLALPPADLIIIDEAHHVAARTWRKIIEAFPNARLLGLSATPCRGDGRGLGKYFNTLIIGPQIPELIAQKHLVRTVYYAPVKPNLAGVETRQGDYVVSQLSSRMDRPDLIGDIVSNWHKHGDGRRTIVFCCDVAHSVHVRDEFIKAGVKAEQVDAATPKTERDAILARLKSGETTVVANCMVLTEGFDCPPVGCIVLARPTKQLGLFRQMAGRGLGPAVDKDNLLLIDHSGGVYRHGLLEDEIAWTLDVTKRAENPTHDKRDRDTTHRLVECTQCSALRKGGEACPRCGFLPKRRADAIVFRDGELARVDRRTLTAESRDDPNVRMKWHGMLAHIAAARGYLPGWTAHKFKERFGTWPPWGAKPVPIEPTPECLSWVRSRQIAFAKAMERRG
jgi:superfamily II DNA or RNA helicase